MKLFAQIRKVDEEKRMVYGRAAQEVVDRVGEVFDYTKSKPYFQEWAKSFSEATDGKSQGNIRAMHGKVSAGIVKDLDFNDTDLAIDIGAHINDDQEWRKVLAGNYTGFSIGGSYVGDMITEKMDGKDVKRYVANPSEISIVDSPCIPTARFFEVVKADGALTKVEFQQPAIEVRGTDDEVAKFGEALNGAGLTLAKAIELVESAAMLDTAEEIEKREFSGEERKAAAKEGAALPDGSFPIKTKGDLRNAISAYGRAKNKSAAKAHIIKRAKDLGASDMLPDAWKEKLAVAEFAKTEAGAKLTGDDLTKAHEAYMQKGMWNVAQFASCLDCVASIASSAQSDADWEGDNSPVPALLRNWLGDGVELFKQLGAEEADELLASLKTQANIGPDDEIENAIEAAAKIGTLRKALDDPALKLGALLKLAADHGVPFDDMETLIDASAAGVNPVAKIKEAIMAKAGKLSTGQMDRLQAAHDHLVGVGASCGGGKVALPDVTKMAPDSLQKEVTDLRATVEKLLAQPVPHVVLRTVAKSYPRTPITEGNEPSGDDLRDAIMAKGYGWAVKNADGSIDFNSSAAKLANEIGAAA